MFFSRSSLTATLLGCVALVPCPGHGEVFRYRPGDDLTQRLRNLQAGDEVVLAGGEYNLGSRFSIGGQGRDDAPIVIRAAEGETPVITRPNANQNTINIEGATHLALVGVEVRGGSHGIRINDSSFITIRDCEVHRTGDVAISANIAGSRYEGLHIVGNHVHHTGGTGEGMYLGCNDGACAMFDSVVEGNYVHHTNQGTSQGDGIEIKRGSFDNIVRDNVIHDTRYPCVLVYGSEEGGPNVIEGNVMWGCGDHAIQAAADTHIVNNLILGAAQDGIRAQPHQGGVPSNLRIVHNTVINAGTAIRLDQVAGPVVVANNALYSTNGAALRASGTLRELTVSGNVGQGGLQGVDGGVDLGGRRGRDFVAAAELDAFPTRNSALLGAADPDFVVGRDFNGTPRGDSLDVGAYVFSAEGNPGWTVGPDFKPAGEVVDPPEADAGPSNPNPDAGGETPTPGAKTPTPVAKKTPTPVAKKTPTPGEKTPTPATKTPTQRTARAATSSAHRARPRPASAPPAPWELRIAGMTAQDGLPASALDPTRAATPGVMPTVAARSRPRRRAPRGSCSCSSSGFARAACDPGGAAPTRRRSRCARSRPSPGPITSADAAPRPHRPPPRARPGRSASGRPAPAARRGTPRPSR